MSDPGWPLQQALFARLTDELSVPVFDAVPMDTPYPYVTIDSEQLVNSSPISGRRRETRLLYLSVWSDYQGQAEVKQILGEMSSALDERPLAIDTGRVVSVRVQNARSNREPDGRTYQGSMTVRIITTH